MEGACRSGCNRGAAGRVSAHGLLLYLLKPHVDLEAEAMTPTRRHIENLVMRIQNAFLDDPALAMTLPAAQRRFGVDGATGAGVLEALVNAGVLTIRGGTYYRRFPAGTERRAA